MNNELKKLLSEEKENVLRSRNERTLTEIEKHKIEVEREIEYMLKVAKNNEQLLTTSIAYELICSYLHNRKRLLEKKPDKFKGTIPFVTASVKHEGRNLIKYFDETIKVANEKYGDKKSLFFWSFDSFRRLAEEIGSYDSWPWCEIDEADDDISNGEKLVLFNKEFFDKQNIKTSIKKDYLYITFTEEALNKFIENLLNNKFREIYFGNKYMKVFKEKIKEVDDAYNALINFKEKAKKNADIIVLEIVKKAINTYNRLPVGYDKKTMEFEYIIYDNTHIKYDGPDEMNVLFRYKYISDVRTVVFDKKDKEKSLSTFASYLNEPLKELGMKLDFRFNSERDKYHPTPSVITVDLDKFEEIVLNVTPEEEIETVKKV